MDSLQTFVQFHLFEIGIELLVNLAQFHVKDSPTWQSAEGKDGNASVPAAVRGTKASGRKSSGKKLRVEGSEGILEAKIGMTHRSNLPIVHMEGKRRPDNKTRFFK